MAHDKLNACPQCGGPFERGFTSRVAPLQFIPIEEFSQFVVVGRDLHDRSWRVRLLPSKAFFSASLNCRSCRLFLVDYDQKLSRQQADAMAASLASRMAAS